MQEAPTTTAPTPQNNPQNAPQQGSRAMAGWALGLAIASVVTSLLVIIATPIALTGVILAIVALSTRRPGKGLSIAALIIGGISLVIIIPFMFLASLVAYNGIQERANESYQESLFQSSNGFKNVQLGVTSPDFVPQLVAEQPSSTVFGTSTADSMTSTAIDTQTLSSYFDAVRGQTAQTVTDSLQF
tara:strand:+ start:241 stop:801 length:561 start_codon:yes stop_codon:yes gene_type:complete